MTASVGAPVRRKVRRLEISIAKAAFVNDRYFVCRTCKSYIDAGYRWACSELEDPGIVVRLQTVSVVTVLGANEYWNGIQEAEWLRALLPQVRQYLIEHQSHDLVYAERDDILDYVLDDEGRHSLEWMNEAGFVLELSPRYFAEKLKFKSWDQVTEYLETVKAPFLPDWWTEAGRREKARAVFDQAVKAMTSSS